MRGSDRSQPEVFSDLSTVLRGTANVDIPSNQDSFATLSWAVLSLLLCLYDASAVQKEHRWRRSLRRAETLSRSLHWPAMRHRDFAGSMSAAESLHHLTCLREEEEMDRIRSGFIHLTESTTQMHLSILTTNHAAHLNNFLHKIDLIIQQLYPWANITFTPIIIKRKQLQLLPSSFCIFPSCFKVLTPCSSNDALDWRSMSPLTPDWLQWAGLNYI